MAESARKLLWLTGWQIGLGVIGTGLLLAALIYSAKQTKAATEANRLSRDTFLADQRPWVSDKAEIPNAITWRPEGCTISVAFLLENIGKTPAFNVI